MTQEEVEVLATSPGALPTLDAGAHARPAGMHFLPWVVASWRPMVEWFTPPRGDRPPPMEAVGTLAAAYDALLRAAITERHSPSAGLPGADYLLDARHQLAAHHDLAAHANTFVRLLTSACSRETVSKVYQPIVGIDPDDLVSLVRRFPAGILAFVVVV